MLIILAVFFMVSTFSVVGIAIASMSNRNGSLRRNRKNEILKFYLGLSGTAFSASSIVLLAVIYARFPQEVQNLPFALTVFSALFAISAWQVFKRDISKFTDKLGEFTKRVRNRVHNFFIMPVRNMRKTFFRSSLGNCLFCARLHLEVAFKRW
ncbi:MAG: hypothetical protein Q7R98_03435 [Candidatus Jorgensenbacteria bacterium]|nr:hypothetical protein [Candidatus Jorgensenbacteria bacterium]